MEPTVTPLAVQTPLQSSGRAAYAYAILSGAAVLALILAGYWAFFSNHAAFRGMRYLAGSFEERTLQEIGWLGTKEVSLPVPGRVTDYARSAASEAAIVQAAGGNQEVYRIISGNSELLEGGAEAKSSLAISSDGSMVAYAARTGTATTTDPSDFYARDAWSVMLVRNAGTRTLMGTGYGPQFFERGGSPYLAYVTERGLHIVDLSTNTHQDVPIDTGTANGFFSASVSPDGAYVAYRTSSLFSLFSLSESEGIFRIAFVGLLPEATDMAAFDGSTLVSAGGSALESLVRISSVTKPEAVLHGKDMSQALIYKLVP